MESIRHVILVPMARIRGEEEWARRCISAALGAVDVVHHDDGSRPRMHDLNILYGDLPPGAVEVTTAADAGSIELWNLVNGGDRWQVDDLTGGWFVELSLHARARRILTDLPMVLRQLEQAGVASVNLRRPSDKIFGDAVASLEINRLSQGQTEYPGSIYLTIDLLSDRSGGIVAETGQPLADWVSAWLQEPTQHDNIEKLARSGASERHLFVVLPGFTVAPFDAAHILMIEDPPLPIVPPVLPLEVTHLWLMSSWNSGTGIRWSPQDGWQHFDKLLSHEASR